MKISALVLGLLSSALAVGSANAACPLLVNPVTIPIGGSVHLTPTDQNCQPIPIGQCTITALSTMPVGMLTVNYDATGAVLNGLAANSWSNVRWKCTDGVNTPIYSGYFTITVPNPPYGVTAVGDTMP